jgi:hypothetical protein
MKTADNGKSDTRYQIYFTGPDVVFLPIANIVNTETETYVQNLERDQVAVTTSTKQRLENYLRYENKQFPLYLMKTGIT